MGTTESQCVRRRLGGFDARLTTVALATGPIALWQIDDLERHVDRRALLASADGPEPPYWALCWSGARVLADAALPRAARVLEVGCGLGLPGLAAARRGAQVLFIDHLAAPLAFVRASALANRLRQVATVAGDLTALPVRGGVELLLAAEVLYDRTTFVPFAREIARVLDDAGEAWLTDAGRIDTQAFYDALPAAGLAWDARGVRLDEDGWPITVQLVRVRRAQAKP